MSVTAALAELRRLAVGLEDQDPVAAADRLMERVSSRENAHELRAALVELGARCLFDAVAALGDLED